MSLCAVCTFIHVRSPTLPAGKAVQQQQHIHTLILQIHVRLGQPVGLKANLYTKCTHVSKCEHIFCQTAHAEHTRKRRHAITVRSTRTLEMSPSSAVVVRMLAARRGSGDMRQQIAIFHNNPAANYYVATSIYIYAFMFGICMPTYIIYITYRQACV